MTWWITKRLKTLQDRINVRQNYPEISKKIKGIIEVLESIPDRDPLSDEFVKSSITFFHGLSLRTSFFSKQANQNLVELISLLENNPVASRIHIIKKIQILENDLEVKVLYVEQN